MYFVQYFILNLLNHIKIAFSHSSNSLFLDFSVNAKSDHVQEQLVDVRCLNDQYSSESFPYDYLSFDNYSHLTSIASNPHNTIELNKNIDHSCIRNTYQSNLASQANSYQPCNSLQKSISLCPNNDPTDQYSQYGQVLGKIIFPMESFLDFDSSTEITLNHETIGNSSEINEFDKNKNHNYNAEITDNSIENCALTQDEELNTNQPILSTQHDENYTQKQSLSCTAQETNNCPPTTSNLQYHTTLPLYYINYRQLTLHEYIEKIIESAFYNTNDCMQPENLSSESLQINEVCTNIESEEKFDFPNLLKYYDTKDTSHDIIINENRPVHALSDDEIYEIINIRNQTLNIHFAFTKPNDDILKFLLDNRQFSSKINKCLMKKEFDPNDSIFINEFTVKLKDEIVLTAEKIRTKYIRYIPKKNLNFVTKYYMNNFCSFCAKNKCIMFSSTYEYSDRHFKIFIQGLKSSNANLRNHDLCNLLEIISDIFQKTETYNMNINIYLFLFDNQRMKLFELIKSMQKTSFYFNKKFKYNLLREIFHNFKCNNSKIKIKLIPEFINIFYLLLNRETNFFFEKSNAMFLIFLFYMRSFEHAINIISQYNLFDEPKKEKDKIYQKTYQNLISLLVRINFVEPLILFFTRNEHTFFRYRFHILSIFYQKYLFLLNQNYDPLKMKFLAESIFWVFNCLNHLHPLTFFEIHNENDMQTVFDINESIFRESETIFNQFYQYELYLQSNSFRKDDAHVDFRDFIDSFKNKIFEH